MFNYLIETEELFYESACFLNWLYAGKAFFKG